LNVRIGRKYFRQNPIEEQIAPRIKSLIAYFWQQWVIGEDISLHLCSPPCPTIAKRRTIASANVFHPTRA
jgi:hypothetical protein